MEAEFDFYPPNTPERVGMEFKAERRKAKLTAADFEKFIELINQPDLLDAKKTYSPRRISPMSVDSEVKKIVTLRRGTQEKEIILEEGECRLYLDGAPSYVVAKSELYPVSLVKLLKFVDSVNIDMRKQIDPNSR